MQDYLPYLSELRMRLIRSICMVTCVFFGLFCMDEFLYSTIAQPFLAQLPAGSFLIATEVTTTFTIPLKLAFILAIFLCIPYLLYELWSFIGPALYRQEKRKILSFLISSTILFYVGVAFAYTLICPMALRFFAHCAPLGVKVMTDIQAYLDFVLSLLLGGGLAFQVPVLTVALIQSQCISIAQLEHFRPYIIVMAFVLGMLLTPPDVISQILLALPMWGLFEIGLFLTKSSALSKARRSNRLFQRFF
jgi:sec-independent protein translocase protein TatC